MVNWPRHPAILPAGALRCDAMVAVGVRVAHVAFLYVFTWFFRLACSHPRLSCAVSSHVVVGVTSQQYCWWWSIICGECVKIPRRWSTPVPIPQRLSRLGDLTGRIKSTDRVRSFSPSSPFLQRLSLGSIGLYTPAILAFFKIYLFQEKTKSNTAVKFWVITLYMSLGGNWVRDKRK